MEFPDLGEHCSHSFCKQLDYLPLKCDACENIFCQEHISYTNHACPSSYKKDVQVPVCPLCSMPVPGKRGEAPDISVGAHIDNDCQSDPAKDRRKVFTNKCSMKNCRGKEVVPVVCGECRRNYCLKHRYPTDHRCEGKAAANRRMTAEAAVARQSRANSSSSRSRTRNDHTRIQGTMTEDEALARALELSLQDPAAQQLDTDANLARALAASLQPRPTTTCPSPSRDKCSLS